MIAMPLFSDRFQLRGAESADLDRVIDLWQSLPGLTLRAEDAAEPLQLLLDSAQQRLFVVEFEEALVGAVLVGDDGRRGFLYHVGVAESMQGKGIGRALVSAALDHLAVRGIARTDVFVNADNPAPQQFWIRLGWRQRTELTVFSHVTELNDAH